MGKRDAGCARLITRNGHTWTERYPAIAQAVQLAEFDDTFHLAAGVNLGLELFPLEGLASLIHQPGFK